MRFLIMSSRRLEGLETTIGDLRQRWWTAAQVTLREQARIALLEQALAKAEKDVSYWRTRAERFIDQVGLKERIIAAPTMTEPEPASMSSVDSVFSALGRSEINTSRTPPPAATPAVLGVDETAARAAIADALVSR